MLKRVHWAVEGLRESAGGDGERERKRGCSWVKVRDVSWDDGWFCVCRRALLEARSRVRTVGVRVDIVNWWCEQYRSEGKLRLRESQSWRRVSFIGWSMS